MFRVFHRCLLNYRGHKAWIFPDVFRIVMFRVFHRDLIVPFCMSFVLEKAIEQWRGVTANAADKIPNFHNSNTFWGCGTAIKFLLRPPWLQKIERIYNLTMSWSMIFREHDVWQPVNHWDRSKISMWPRGDRIKTLRFSEITLVSTSSRVSTQLLNIEKQQKYIQALIMWEEIFRTPAPASTNARLVAFGIAEYL